MEDKIQNKNRIPGCDKLTQPYEIKALSKYLKAIKKVREDSLELGKDNLEMSATGPIQIEELPSGSLSLENYLDNIDSLPSDSLKIEDQRNLESLPSESLILDDANIEYSELPQDKIAIEKEEENIELEDARLDLEVDSEPILEDTSLEVPGEISDQELSNNLQKMVGDILEKTSLESRVEKIPDQKDDVDLEKDIIKLEGTERDINLRNTIEKLEATEKDVELSGKVEKLYPKNEVTELDSSINVLGDIKEINTLESEVKTIETEDISNLDISKEKVPGKVEDLELSKKREELSDNRKPQLDTSKEKIVGKVKDVSKLEKSKEKISDKRNIKLEKEKPLKLSDAKRDIRLGKTKETIPDKKEDISQLEDTLLKVTEEPIDEIELGDKIYTLDDVLFESELPNESISLYDLDAIVPDQKDLSDTKINIEGEIKEPELEGSKEELDVEVTYIKEEEYGQIQNVPNVTDGYGNRPSYSEFLSDPAELVSDRSIEWKNKVDEKGNQIKLDQLYALNKNTKSPRSEEGIQDIRDIPEDFSERLQYTIDELKKEGDWGKRILAYLSVITNRSSEFADDIPQADVEKFEALLAKTVSSNSKLSNKVKQYMPSYDLPNFSLERLDPSSWLRAVAEKTVGLAKNIHGKLRAILVDEALGLLILGREKLEKVAEAEKHRLPGDASPFSAALSGGSLVGAVSNTIGALAGSPLDYPINRPMKDGKNPVNKNDILEEKTKNISAGVEENIEISWDEKVASEEETSWTDVLGRTEKGKIIEGNDKKKRKAADYKERKTGMGKALQKLGNAIGGKKKRGDYSFSDYYIQNSEGIQKTIEELVGSDVNVKSVETFFHDLETSPYMTTQSKVTGTSNQYKVSTLDSNSYWEIKLQPYFGEANGYYTFLPDIGEINENNKKLFGIDTAYSQWIPITSFELQKKKLTQKTLGLYDGEISYPVSMEFLNEFRITIIDDAYKSWKTYFQKCAEVSVFCSQARTPGTGDYFGKKYTIQDDEEQLELSDAVIQVYPTILQDEYLVAMYKNITFRCELYVMTPQLATVIKYDLLLVMKDFQEEYSGEASDSPASDLTISFSIVGENPIEKFPKPGKIELEPQITSERSADYATIASQALNKGLSLLK